jgi:hypothetical protein
MMLAPIVVSREDVMESVSLLDCAGRRRSPATLPSFHQGRAPRNKGLRYPPEPPTVEEIFTVMRAAGDHPDAVLVRRGKAGERREVGMDRWAWEKLDRGSRSVRAFPWARCSASCAV